MIFPFLKFKKQQAPCIAEGPSINRAQVWRASFQGSEFSIAAPPSNEKGLEPDRSPRGRYSTDNHFASYSFNRWKDQTIMNRRYRFWGPRGTGEVNSMSWAAWFSRPHKPKEGVSFFHPRAFEFEVIDYIEDNFVNYPEEKLIHMYPNTVRVPIDWQTFNHLPGPTVFFHVDTGTTSAINYYFATVLDDNDLLFVGFRLKPNRTGPKHIPPEEWVDMRNMKQLMFDIFNTLELKLSPEAEARRLKAIKGLEDTSLKKTMETQTFYTHPDQVQDANLDQLPKRAG